MLGGIHACERRLERKEKGKGKKINSHATNWFLGCNIFVAVGIEGHNAALRPGTQLSHPLAQQLNLWHPHIVTGHDP